MEIFGQKLTVERVKAAVAALGDDWTLDHGAFWDYDCRHCCPIGAVILEAARDPDAPEEIKDLVSTRTPDVLTVEMSLDVEVHGKLQAWIMGFDSALRGSRPTAIDRYPEAYAEGQAFRRELLP